MAQSCAKCGREFKNRGKIRHHVKDIHGIRGSWAEFVKG